MVVMRSVGWLLWLDEVCRGKLDVIRGPKGDVRVTSELRF